MDPVRIGIAGCGSISVAHALGWMEDVRATIVAVADPSVEARGRLARLIGQVEQYEDFRSMIASSSLDALSICLRAEHHLEAVALAADHGVTSVVCEKPLADNLADAAQISAIGISGLVMVASGHQRRYYPQWVATRELFMGGTLGLPEHAWVPVSGGLLNNATHAVDMVRFLTGDPAVLRANGAVKRSINRRERGLAVEELGTGVLECDNGMMISVDCNVTPSATVECRADILTTHATVHVREHSVIVRPFGAAGFRPGHEHHEPIRHGEALAETCDIVRGVFQEASLRPFARTFVAQARAVVDAVNDGGAQSGILSDGQTAFSSMEAVCGLFEATSRLSSVDFPLTLRPERPVEWLVATSALPLVTGQEIEIRP